jgi:hypothetical protein
VSCARTRVVAVKVHAVFFAAALSKRAIFVCVFITAAPSTKLFTWGGGGIWEDMCYRDNEPRPVWTRLPMTH